MKFCKECGAQLEDNVKFCTACGAKVIEEAAETPIEEPVVETPSEEIPEVTAPEAPDVPEVPSVATAVNLVKDEFPVTAVVFAFLACLISTIPGIIFANLSKKKLKAYINNGGQNQKLAKTVKIFANIALALAIISTVAIAIVYVVYGAILGTVLSGNFDISVFGDPGIYSVT